MLTNIKKVEICVLSGNYDRPTNNGDQPTDWQADGPTNQPTDWQADGPTNQQMGMRA